MTVSKKITLTPRELLQALRIHPTMGYPEGWFVPLEQALSSYGNDSINYFPVKALVEALHALPKSSLFEFHFEDTSRS